MATILVVDDEDDLREVTVLALEGAGHSTLQAENGQQGLKLLIEHAPDLVVSDISMPVMNGYQFLRTLKEKHPEHADTPFLFLSALIDREDELKGLRLGVDDYLTKPIDLEILVARVDARLARVRPSNLSTSGNKAPATPEEPMSFGTSDDDFDTSGEDAFRAGQPDPANVEKAAGLARQRDGQLVAGKLTTVSLDDIRARVGERWPDMASKITRHAEQVIESHLTETDIVHMSPSNDFLICFGKLDAEQAALKIDLIRDELWERLFGETRDEALSAVSSEVHEIELSSDALRNGEQIFDEVDRCLPSSSQETLHKEQLKLKNAYQNDDFRTIRLGDGEGNLSAVRRIVFDRNVRKIIRNIRSSGSFTSEFFLDLNKVLIDRLASKFQNDEFKSNARMILPVHFSTLMDSDRRKTISMHCQKFDKRFPNRLLIEVVGAPDRLSSHADTLQPLPVGSRIQFLEVRKPQQLMEVDLKSVRIGLVSIAFEHALHYEGSGLQELKDGLGRHGVKLHIKDIPKDGLPKARTLKADLYSLDD